ncbi:hypothetical protein NpNSSI1_00005512 [Neofusicoccum parvum]|nr:hypothetical protein NpNSSI1_00005512 [Neofusicoccum parvum]
MSRQPPDRLLDSPGANALGVPSRDTTTGLEISIDNHKPRRNMHNIGAPKEDSRPERATKTAAKSTIADNTAFWRRRRRGWTKMPERATKTAAMPKMMEELEKGFLERRAAKHRKGHEGLEDEDMAGRDFSQVQNMSYVIPDLAIRKKAKEGHTGLKDVEITDGDNQNHKPPQHQVSLARFSALALSMRKSLADVQTGKVSVKSHPGALVCKRCFYTINTREHCVGKPPCHFCQDEAPYCQCSVPAHTSNI